jgi:hypothetical protein
MTETDRRFAEEIADLHSFFGDWFAGKSDRTIGEFADRLDAGFTIVGPHGEAHGKAHIVALVEGRFGAYDVEITTSEAHVTIMDPVMVGTYEEHHRSGDATTRRIATVAMVEDHRTPTGYRWLSVHETWVEETP